MSEQSLPDDVGGSLPFNWKNIYSLLLPKHMTSSLTIYKLEQIQTITHQLVFIVSEEIKKKTLVRGT